MKLVIAAACLAASLSLASHALADGRTVVTLQQPLPAATQFVAGGAAWRCEGATCIASYTPDETFGPSQCRAVAKQAGPVVSFQDETRTLQPAMLDRCNANIGPKTSLAASH